MLGFRPIASAALGSGALQQAEEGSVTLTANPGVYTLTGVAVNLARGLKIGAVGDTYKLRTAEQSILLHFDGTDGSTDIRDETRQYPITVVGNAQIDTAQSVFGSGSLLLDGTGDYIQLPGADSYPQHGFHAPPNNAPKLRGNATIDFWIRFSAYPSSNTFPLFGSTNNGGSFGIQLGTDGKLTAFNGAAGLLLPGSGALAVATWHHVALTKVGTDGYFFVNGELIRSFDLASANRDNFSHLHNIGAGGFGFSPFAGWIDEFRLLDDQAAWTEAFTPPTAAYALSKVTLLKRAVPLPVNSGSYALTGTATTLLRHARVTANSGTYALTGTAVELVKTGAVVLTADVGSYTLTGVAATLRRTLRVTANVGAYALTGTQATLARGLRTGANAGLYSLTGTQAGLRRGFAPVLNAGSYALTGIQASLRRGLAVTANVGVYSLTGTQAAFRRTYNLAANSGVYSLTGQAVSLTTTGSFSLPTDVGVYTLTGIQVTTRVSRRIVANSGVYALTGTTTGLRRGLRVAANSGVYTLTGRAVTFTLTRAITATPGVYTLTGQTVSLVTHRRAAINTGSYALTGRSVDLRTLRRAIAASGIYVLTGTQVDLTRIIVRIMPAAPGSYVLTGLAVTLDANVGGFAQVTLAGTVVTGILRGTVRSGVTLGDS